MITELLGTPSMEDMRHACDGARTHMLRRVPKQPSLSGNNSVKLHVRWKQLTLVFYIVISSLHTQFARNTRSCSFAVSDVGVRSGKLWKIVSRLSRYLTINSRFTQDKRISVIDALAHPYLDEGRLRYHSCMCKCCYTTSGGMRQYTADFEPAATQPFDDLWERKLTSVQQVKG